jgi:hypothetical protein
MFCPVCAGEYRPGFTECADCGVPLVSEPPASAMPPEHADPHDLVPLLESLDLDVLDAARGRLHAMGIPCDTAGLPRHRDEEQRVLQRPGRILVARSRREQAERCLAGVEEGLEAQRRELERHGFGSDDEAEPRPVLYCPRCASEHRGFSRCVDCGERLVAERPLRAEAEPVELFATLDVEQLAAARQALAGAGIPFDWGRLTAAGAAWREEPPPSPLIPAGWIYVPAARETDARRALGRLPGLVAWDDGGDELPVPGDAAFAASATPGGEIHGGDLGDEDLAAAAEPTLYCPRCRGEYRAGFARCVDCDVPLVRTLDAPAAAPALRHRLEDGPPPVQCAGCGAPLPSADAICPRCSPPDDEDEEEDTARGYP